MGVVGGAVSIVAGRTPIRFADVAVGEHFYLNGFRLVKTGSGTAVVKETPLGKELHKGRVKLLPEHFEFFS